MATSKFVSKSDTPQDVFHYTPDVELGFTVFDPDKATNALDALGTHVGTAKAASDRYEKTLGKGFALGSLGYDKAGVPIAGIGDENACNTNTRGGEADCEGLGGIPLPPPPPLRHSGHSSRVHWYHAECMFRSFRRARGTTKKLESFEQLRDAIFDQFGSILGSSFVDFRGSIVQATRLAERSAEPSFLLAGAVLWRVRRRGDNVENRPSLSKNRPDDGRAGATMLARSGCPERLGSSFELFERPQFALHRSTEPPRAPKVGRKRRSSGPASDFRSILGRFGVPFSLFFEVTSLKRVN